MKGRTRLLLGLACALLALVVVGVVLQAVRTLLWDLSYFLPPWLLTPILLLGLTLLATAVVQVGLLGGGNNKQRHDAAPRNLCRRQPIGAMPLTKA